MSEDNKITTGDVVCLKHQKDDNKKRKFTVGASIDGEKYYIHWVYQGEFKQATVAKGALHKIE